MKMAFSVSGMTCDHCVRTLTTSLAGVDGVTDPHVSLDDARATLTLDEARCTTQKVVEAIRGAGFQVTGFAPTD
jgi:copper chaperone CopZ